LNDPEMEKIYERAMNANNEKSRHLYLHALGDRVESQVQNTILANKGLRNSLFQGVKLDRNAFLQSNGKYISFTKNYKFRPGGSVAEAEKSWAGKLLSGLGFKLDTVGSGNLIDKIGGLLAGKLLDGTDDLYNAPEMPMRFNLHYRGAGNQNYLPYDYENGRYAPKHTGAWWQEDINIASKQEYKPQNWTPDTIDWYYVLNPRTQQWERPGGKDWTSGRYGRDYEGQTVREQALAVVDEFWWLDPNFKDLSGYNKEKVKEELPTDNVYDDLTATDAATLAANRRKKKKSKVPQGLMRGITGTLDAITGNKFDFDKRGDGVNESVNHTSSAKRFERRMNRETALNYKYPARMEKKQKVALKHQKRKEMQKWSPKTEPNSNELYPGQPSPNGFPDTPPPELAPNGYHPEYGKQAKRYTKLDPVSAVMMNKVKTDDPETNKQVAAAAKKPKVKKNKVSEAVWPKGLWRKAKRYW